MPRTVIIEFDSVEQAVAAYESPACKAALDALGNSAERDLGGPLDQPWAGRAD